jgi:hypothetical protein
VKRRRSYYRLAVAAVTASILGWTAPAPAAPPSQEQLQQLAAKFVGDLARACPHKPGLDQAAFQFCAAKLAQATDMPFGPAVLWGGDQEHLRIKDRHLTRFNGSIFRDMYMPLLSFTGKYTLEMDQKEGLGIIRAEAYFRNELPPGDYPYPFWHTDAKWNAYEVMNRMSFYVDNKGRIMVVTRGDKGSNESRGKYSHVTPPAFVKDQWVWTDPSGQQQPRVMMFSYRYQTGNPSLPRLDKAYRELADNMREASCQGCHSPDNSGKMHQLILLQTPLHAAGEVERIIKSVTSGSMPENDMGLPEDIDPKLRAAIIRSAQVFKDELNAANAWEAGRRRTGAPVAGSAPAGQPAAR